jgi:hypothetical protein
MIMTGVSKRATLCMTFFAMTAICMGCTENKPVTGGGGNVGFRGRTCPVGAPEEYAVEVVASQQVLQDPADDVIFLCGGDKVSWFIQSGTGVIKITFTDSYADDLFGAGHSKFQSHPGSQKSETDKQTVKSPKEHPGRRYKYTIEVEDPAGSAKGKIDPHVIPM